jgi:type IV fimbrial biogenesis protein FimT
MVACFIVGLLLAIGVPSYRFVTASNRVSSEINGLLGDLQYARAEAIRQGVTVSVCAATNATTCANSGTNWATGWLVFSDSSTSGALGTVDTATDVILRYQKALGGTDTFTADQTIRFITFNRDGFVQNAPAGVTFTLNTNPTNVQYKRCLSTTLVGAIGVQRNGQNTMESASTAVTC